MAPRPCAVNGHAGARRAPSRRSCCASPPPARSTTARARSSAACSTTPRGSSRTSSSTSSETRRERGDGYVDLALLTDGLRAEREQGITIDVAYRYFATPRRKFIIADTPGHVQYTRNMVTGASTADLAIVLVDARKGVLEQSRRHAFIASLLRHPARRVRGQQDGPRRLRRGGLRAHRRGVRRAGPASSTSTTSRSSRSPRCTATTSSTRSERMPWYEGPSLLYHLEHVHIALRPQPDRRALPGAVGDPPEDRRAPRLPRLRRPGRRRRVPRRATRSSCCRRARGRASRAIETFDGAVDGGLPAAVGDACCSRTTSTSRAAT